MKRLRYIVSLVLCALSLCAWSQDLARLGERSITGTARYIGMGGAMSAIGADPSATLDNSAALGLYRRTEVLVSFDQLIDRTRQVGTANTCSRLQFMLPQASIVISIPTFNPDNVGVQFNNFQISYQRVNAYSRMMYAEGTNGASLGALVNTPSINWDIPFCTLPTNAANAMQLIETGYTNEYALDWAMNIKNRWYVGAGLHVQSYLLSSEAVYRELFEKYATDGKAFANTNTTKLILSGVTCNFSAGLICRPLKWLRLGFGIQTPAIGSIVTSTSGTFAAQTDSLRYSYAPDGRSSDRNFHMPLHTSTSVAFQIGAYGMAALQYDYRHSAYMDDWHSLRVGLEVIPVMGMYINAGYAYESTFRSAARIVPMDDTFNRQDTYFLQNRWSQYASCAIGYRGQHVIVQAAYQYRWQHIGLYAHENAGPYNMRTDTHRIVLTIGWHRE